MVIAMYPWPWGICSISDLYILSRVKLSWAVKLQSNPVSWLINPLDRVITPNLPARNAPGANRVHLHSIFHPKLPWLAHRVPLTAAWCQVQSQHPTNRRSHRSRHHGNGMERIRWSLNLKNFPSKFRPPKKAPVFRHIWHTPLKINMEPNNEGLEDGFPCETGDFQVPC